MRVFDSALHSPIKANLLKWIRVCSFQRASPPLTSFYGPEDLVINSSGNLETPTAPVGASSAAAFTKPLLISRRRATIGCRASTDEIGPGNHAVSRLWMQSFDSGFLYEAMFGTFVGANENSFLIETRVRQGSSLDATTYLLGPRTSGPHSFGIDWLPNGNVNWFLDSVLVLTTTQADWLTGQFDRVLLFAQGSASGQISTWPDFSLSVPEPSGLALFMTAVLALTQRRRREPAAGSHLLSE